MKNVIVGLAAVAGLAGAAVAQHGFLIAVDYGPGQSSVNPGNPSCEVRVSARFSAPDFAFAAARWAVNAGEAGWSGNQNVAPFTTGSNPGTINGASVNEIIGGQIHFPPPLPANPANPALVWKATWSTNNFATRDVAVSTATTRFDVYISETSPASQSRLQGLTEGAGTIHVTPAPSALALLGLGGLVAGRRRR